MSPALEPSFDELYRAHRDSLVRLAALVLGSTAVADDIVHDAFGELHRQWHTVDNPGGWLRTVVVRRCLNERRRWHTLQRLLPRLSGAPTTHEVLPSEPLPSEPLADALATLPVRQRTAVVLRYYADLSEADTAAAMNVSIGTVKSTVHRALAQLRAVAELSEETSRD